MATKPMKTLKLPGLDDTYTFLQNDTTLAVSGKAADAKATGDALAAVQAHVDGVQAGQYPDMGAGQLLSTTGTVNPTPYTYRENASGSDRVTISQITGGTVAFNQLVVDDNVAERTNNGVTVSRTGRLFTVTGTGTATSWNTFTNFKPTAVFDHVYLLLLSNDLTGTAGVQFAGFTSWLASRTTTSKIGKCTETATATSLQIRVAENESWNNSFYLGLFDLTQMFGAAVAQYFLDLETATPGAGIALFQQMFPASYYPYNAGELVSVQTSGRVSGGRTYPLDSTLTLRGVPVLSGGVPAYDGDQYAPDGTVTRRYGIVDLGTLTWSLYQSTAGAFGATISVYRKAAMNDVPDFICGSAKYTPINSTNSAGILAADDKTIVHPYNGSGIIIKDSEYGSDYSALAASLSGVYLVYELATPTTETAAPYQEVQIAGSTEEFLPPETDTRPAAVPVGSVSLYQTNMRAGLEKVLGTLNGADPAHAESIAPVQGGTASTNIAEGELLMRDGKLYTATQAIVAGAEIGSTNTTETTLAAQLAALEARIAALEN